MMTAASLLDSAVECQFADGAGGRIPYSDVPEITDRGAISNIELPNAYEIIISLVDGRTIDIPWDFARHYCDDSYRPTVEALARSARDTLGARLRKERESAGLTQEQLAEQAGIGRVTLVRLENGEQTPRFGTLRALAQSLGIEVNTLLVGES